MARPPKPETEKLISVSLRIPRALYAEVQERVQLRRTTLTALVLEGLRLCLDTPVDPREVSVVHSTTAMQELEALIDARVYAILATERQREPVRVAEQPRAKLLHDDNITVIPDQEAESMQDGNAVIPTQPQKRAGRPRSPMGQRILTLLREYPEGLTAEQIRGHLAPERPLGDILAGMRKTGAVQSRGAGRQQRYVLPLGS
jgi:hypothetical protein